MSAKLFSLLATSALLAASLPTADAQSQSVSISPALNRNQARSVSPVISPSYAGMGIEPSNLLSFTGTSQTNQLTFQLLSNLANYTGVPPHIRVGGNTGDNMLYSSSVTSYFLEENPNASGQGYSQPTDFYLFGPNYFEAMDRLPAGTPITYGVNLAYTGSDYSSRMVEQANAAFDNLKNVSIVGLEIGNEPDLYVQNGYRPSGWSATEFGNEWAARAKVLYEQVLKPRNLPTNFFEPAVTATTATKSGQAFRIANLVNTQVATDNGIYVAGWNQHDYYYFIGVSTYSLTLDRLLDLSQTTSQFKEWSDQAGQALVTGKPYYLREMGSVGPTGLQGISDTFANTLWTFNFFLFAATQQISSVQMHLTDNSFGSPWQPVTINGTAPYVRSSYYAWAAFDQLVGAACNTRIAPIDLSGTPGNYQNRLVAYAVYRDDNLQSVVMINTQPYYSYSSSSSPPSVTFNVNLPSLAGQTMYSHILTAAGAESTTNTTWNGISYEQSGTGRPTTVSQNPTQPVTISSTGSLSVTVRDSQAIVLNLGSRLGSEAVNAANCNALSSTQPEGGENNASGTTPAAPAPTFKATSGFKSDSPLSRNAIIGIAVGGGVFLIIVFALLVFCCVRCFQRKERKRREAAMLASRQPRYDSRPLLGGGDSRAMEMGAHSSPGHGSPAFTGYGQPPYPHYSQPPSMSYTPSHMSTPPQRFLSTVPAMDGDERSSSSSKGLGRAL